MQVEVCVIINGSAERVTVSAKTIDFTQTSLNLYVDKRMVASFLSWIYFRVVSEEFFDAIQDPCSDED